MSLISFTYFAKISNMMNVKYIGHSSFLVELNNSYLLFDYYTGGIPELDDSKTIYVFSSHHHGDHFNLEIFNFMEKYSNVVYIFSRDIRRKYGKKINIEVNYIPSGASEVISDIRVETLRSTDEGVAYIITAEDKTIYHAGDLNLWIWKEESNEYNSYMELRYKKEIDKIKGRHFDLAFLVLDSRQEEYAIRGFDYFMRNTETDIVYPMHYWSDASIIKKLISNSVSTSYRDKIIQF